MYTRLYTCFNKPVSKWWAITIWIMPSTVEIALDNDLPVPHNIRWHHKNSHFQLLVLFLSISWIVRWLYFYFGFTKTMMTNWTAMLLVCFRTFKCQIKVVLLNSSQRPNLQLSYHLLFALFFQKKNLPITYKGPRLPLAKLLLHLFHLIVYGWNDPYDSCISLRKCLLSSPCSASSASSHYTPVCLTLMCCTCHMACSIDRAWGLYIEISDWGFSVLKKPKSDISQYRPNKWGQ